MNQSADPVSKRIVLAAGGTGGHVFPALALARLLGAQGHRVLFVTDQRGKAYVGTSHEPFDLCVLPFGRIEKSGVEAVQFWVSYAFSFLQMLYCLMRFWPHKVMGYGGFPTVPVLLAACLLGRPCYGHEQDTVLSKVNRLFAPVMRKLFLAYPIADLPACLSAEKLLVVGMTLRPEIVALQQRLYTAASHQEPFHLLILGGSQGASVFSDLVPAAVALLKPEQQKRLVITQQARPEDIGKVQAAYDQMSLQVTVQPFFKNVDQLLQKANLIISRAGAVAIAESASAGVPGILVPLPSAMADHQTHNAALLANKGAGWLLHQNRSSATLLASYLEDLMQFPHKLLYASERLSFFSKKKVAETLAYSLLSV